MKKDLTNCFETVIYISIHRESDTTFSGSSCFWLFFYRSVLGVMFLSCNFFTQYCV